MATDNTDNPGERPLSMKERLQAQRRAEAAARETSVPPVPAARPVARPTPATTANPAPAARPAPAAPSAAPKSAPLAAASRVRAPAASPAPAPRAPRRDAKAMSADVQREVELLRKRQDKWLMYGWVVAGVLILIAGGAYFYSQATVTQREKAAAAYVKAMNDLMTEISGMPLNSIDQAQKIIARAEETKVTTRMPDGRPDTGWKDTHVAGVSSKIAGTVAKATTYIKSETTRNELINGLAALEADVRDASNKKPDELAGLRRRLSEYENGASAIGAEFETRVAKAKIDLNRAVAKRLYDEAKVVAAKGEARAALVAYAKAEDEMRTLMDEAYTRRNADAIAWIEPLYQEVITESDKISTAAFTPDIIEKTPWIDVIATTDIKGANDGFKGFRQENGQIQAIGPDPGSKREGIFSVGDLEHWRDFVMEVEFIPVRGHTKLYWRLGKQVQAAPDEVHVDLAGTDGYEPNKTYSITATYIGSKRTFEYSPNLEVEADILDGIGWRKQRVGAFGFVLSEGAEFKVTKLRVKVLRGGKGR